ncbi:MAG: hypothetical protein AVDCRST_MAG67-3457 [uncultured Solirubrobacteraceae bacterium]|uniref:Uncharacterized protein n=1 Tax=uncultured Solirubrobacteraceae bacterium TaxID=1162706 RepID=A0A6J4THM0_9ACTN|nr:MAG: hypothetical protein AVDCRST_MAG67-3457 [uncultured Solirubrobacteraceae bacterium]
MILAAAMLFIGMLSALTVYVAVTSGITFLTLVALLVLGMFASGIVGVLRHRPPED